jgi:hypothetical protein
MKPIVRNLVLLVLIATCFAPSVYTNAQNCTHTATEFIFLTDRAHQLKTAYVDILDELEASKVYWESVDFHPIRYLLAQSPLYWITGKTRSKVKRKHLKELDALCLKVTTELGLLQKALNELQETQSDEAAEKIRELVEKEIGKYGSSKTYKRIFLRKNEKWLQPNHFVRNWVPYTLTGLTAGATALYVYKNPEKTQEYLTKLQTYAHHFYIDNVRDPYQNFKRRLFEGREQDKKEFEARGQNLGKGMKTYLNGTRPDEQAIKELQELAKRAQAEKEIKDKNKSYYDKVIEAAINKAVESLKEKYDLKDRVYPQITPEQRQAFIEDAEKTGNIDIVFDDFVDELNHALLNSVRGNTGPQFKMMGLRGAYEYAKAKTDYAGSMGVGIITPIMLTAYAAAKLGIYGYTEYKKIFPRHVKKLLLNLQYFYNDHLYDTDGMHEPDKMGLQTYYHSKLEQISPGIPGNDRLQFKHDLGKLISTTETNQQKYNLISVMLNRYEWLRA